MDQEQFHTLIAGLSTEIAALPLDASLAAHLNSRHGPGSPLFDRIFSACQSGMAEGWMGNYEGGGIRYGRVIKASEASTSPIQVVVAHHPPYSSGEHGAIKGADWDFEKHGVELMLAGHDHNYERIQQDGITYIVNGAGGGNLRRMHKEGQIENSEIFYHTKHGAQLVEVKPVEGKPGTWELTSKFIDVEGAEIDTFTVTGTAPSPAATAASGPAGP